MKTPNPIITVHESEGKKLKIAGGNYRIVLSGTQSDGEYALIEMSIPPGAGPNPHSHADFTETFFVLEGEVFFKSELGSCVVKKGSFVSIPKGGIVHCFKNISNQPAKLLCTVAPAGLENLFEEIAEYLETASSNTESETKEKMNSLFEKYGQKMFPADYLD